MKVWVWEALNPKLEATQDVQTEDPEPVSENPTATPLKAYQRRGLGLELD